MSQIPGPSGLGRRGHPWTSWSSPGSTSSSSHDHPSPVPSKAPPHSGKSSPPVGVIGPSPRRQLQFGNIPPVVVPKTYCRTKLLKTFISFPFVDNSGKQPAVKQWTTLRKTVAHKAGTKYGILLGKPSNLLVVDLDVLKTDDPHLYMDGIEAWNQIVAKYKPLASPESDVVVPTVKTPSGGFHFYYRYDEQVNDKCGGVKTLDSTLVGDTRPKKIKIDILANNRCVIGPGSPGYSHWDFDVDPPAKMPQWLKDAFMGHVPAGAKRQPPASVVANKRRKLSSEAELVLLVERIHPVFAEQWDPWQKIVRAIAKVGHDLGADFLHVADDFSKKCLHKYKGQDDVRKTYQQRNNDVGAHTLHKFGNATADEIAAGTLNTFHRDREPFDLVNELLQLKPSLRERYVACNEKSWNTTDGIYHCDSSSGVWAKAHNLVIDKMLQGELMPLVQTQYETKLVKLHIKSVREAFFREVYDQNLYALLNNNRDVFALQNTLFDVRTKAMRPAVPRDWVNKTAGWDYSDSDSQRHMPEVLNFLEQVFPHEDERKVVLAFLACLLSGHRTEGKFLVLMDGLGGHNGKSTFLALLKTFFGDYHLNGVNFITTSNTKKDRDSHDGGAFAMCGTRIILADETTRKDYLNVSKMKYWTGGAGVTEGGRHMHSERRSSFPFQAGIVICCNEGDFPQFDTSDLALAQRMIVCPMRSKFTTNARTCDASLNIYPCDLDIVKKLPSWRSAFFDHLRCVHYGKSEHVLYEENAPPSMLDMRKTLFTEKNVVGQWLEEAVSPVQETYFAHPREMLTLNMLFQRYSASHPNKMGQTSFYKQAKAYFQQVGGTVRQRLTYRENGGKQEIRNVVVNYKLN